jgi:hypothetical protein
MASANIIVDKNFYKNVKTLPYTGFIYVIHNTINEKVYVGQTIQQPYVRWGQHINCARSLIKYHTYKNTPDYKPPKKINQLLNSPLYSAIVEYGIDKFYMNVEFINICPDELNELEVDYIEEYNSLHPNGYNLSSGGGSGQYITMKTVEFQRRNYSGTVEGRPDNMLDDLPKHVSYVHSPDNIKWGGHHYIVTKHPRCYQRRFFFKKHGSAENAKIAVLNFLADLEVNDIIWEKPKNGGDELKQYKGLKLTNKGYKVEITDGDNYYCRRFGNRRKYTLEELKIQAVNYWNEIRNQIQTKGQILV